MIINRRPGRAAEKLRRIKRAVHAHGLRIVLFSWGAESEPRLRNLSALKPDGSVQWTAELPSGTGRDCFVKLEAIGTGIVATTFSGRQLRLCPVTGGHLA